MRIVVLTKWVPSPEGTPELGPDHLVVREGVEGALDPSDEVGIEAALQLVERDGGEGGEVVAVSMGPDEALAAVQRALAMGVHRGILITDPALRGADTLVTARVLAAAIAPIGPDLVIAGVESTDGYTGTLPVTLAELLAIDAVTAARRIDVVDGRLRAERQTDAGYDVIGCALPAVVALTLGATQPRYPSLRGIMAAKTKPLERPSTAELGLEPADLVPTQRVVDVRDAPDKPGGVIVEADPTTPARIADLLAEAGVL
jgi:electron transfer flavoprotein beta subunit